MLDLIIYGIQSRTTHDLAGISVHGYRNVYITNTAALAEC